MTTKTPTDTTNTTPDNITKGRNDLLAWQASKPKNFFLADSNLQNVLRQYMGDEALEKVRANLESFGAEAATTLDQAATIEDRIGNHPRLERWSNLGERIEQIEFHPNHDVMGEVIWKHEMMALQREAGNVLHQMGLYYMLGHNGEASHMCSLACTSGLIRALQQEGDPELQAKYLPPLLNPDYEQMQHGAQFLTEVQGGSDVGANAVTATQTDDGTWRISGEKWFCSNINADQFLMTARATSAEGTRGLGLFLVPRTLDDGTTNGFFMRRLKDKLGTRTLASAELDFVEAVAYNVGAVEKGFKTAVELVLNTSRLMNAVACTGVIRRAYYEAGHYACKRQAFGNSIASYPMVQEAVADIMSEAYAATSTSFYLAYLLDEIETGRASDEQRALYRLLVNANKYITAIRGSEMVHRAIEVLGGNGAIESFSVLPRLYRDMVVLESWEGTHNVLALQILRDIQRYNIHEPFFADLQTKLEAISADSLRKSAEYADNALKKAWTMLARMNDGGMDYAQAHARRLMEHLGQVAQAILMLHEAQWEIDHNLDTVKADVITHFVNKHLVGDYDVWADDSYLPRIERLMQAL
jgi:acyl-CoA dehydrogenase